VLLYHTATVGTAHSKLEVMHTELIYYLPKPAITKCVV